MEDSFAKLAISPCQSAFLDVGPSGRFNCDEAMKRFKALCDEADAEYPLSPQTCIFYPGRFDCYWLDNEERRRSHMAKCSEKALAYFNNKNNTDYKFENYVEITYSGEDHSHAVHCNFTAKPETAPLKAGDFSSKLFFAELIPIHPELSLTHCSMLDGAETDYKYECAMCPLGVIYHPISFRDGYKPPLV